MITNILAGLTALEFLYILLQSQILWDDGFRT